MERIGMHRPRVRREADADADADAEELFKGVYPVLAGWVRRLVGDDDTAHEIASEAFVRLLARWAMVESPRSYLYMIATNLIRDHWRKTEREGRALRSVTAGSAADPVAFLVQDVDVRAQGGRVAAAPARGNHQVRPVRGAGQAEDRAGTRWMSGTTTSRTG
jgi:DNA-directed RNA polymerase specialized sigma24 family protein